MTSAFIVGTGNTAFGRFEGRGALDLMAEAATRALADANLVRGDIDAVLCGYATTFPPHLIVFRPRLDPGSPPLTAGDGQ